jgi:HAD superfamily hydrolase (TIGR01509 family)
MIKGAIFDLDGTLVSTAVAHKTAWELALKEMGIEREVNLDMLMGMRTLEIAKILANERYMELYEKKNNHYRELVKRLASPTCCAEEILWELRKRGVKIAVVTSSIRSSAQLSLSVLNFKPDLIVAGDDVERGKPDPEPVIKALKAMNLSPKEVFGVGDTLQDVIAYYKANIERIFLVVSELNINREEGVKYGAKIIQTLCKLRDLVNTS